LTKYLIRVN